MLETFRNQNRVWLHQKAIVEPIEPAMWLGKVKCATTCTRDTHKHRVPQAQATLAALGHFRRLLASFLHYFACPNYRKVALLAPPHSNFRSKFKKVNTLLPRYHVKLPTFERAQLDCDRGGWDFGSKSASGLALNFPATEPEGVGGNEAHVNHLCSFSDDLPLHPCVRCSTHQGEPQLKTTSQLKSQINILSKSIYINECEPEMKNIHEEPNPILIQ